MLRHNEVSLDSPLDLNYASPRIVQSSWKLQVVHTPLCRRKRSLPGNRREDSPSDETARHITDGLAIDHNCNYHKSTFRHCHYKAGQR